MRQDMSLETCFDLYGDQVSPELMTRLRADLDTEISSIELRAGMEVMWRNLKGQGVKLAICSNLALPYGPPLLDKLPSPLDVTILSYELGFIKPEPEIYHAVAKRLDLSPSEILFTGDTQLADVDGPRLAGMQSIHITEFETL